MKIAEGFVLRKIAGEHIIAGEGLARVDFSKVISLNPSAAYLWSEVQGKEFGPDELVRLLLDRYDVDEATARKDVTALLEGWREAGLIEE